MLPLLYSIFTLVTAHTVFAEIRCGSLDDQALYDRYCVYTGTITLDWFTANRYCSALKASATVVDVLAAEGNSTELAHYLEDQSYTAVWVEAKRAFLGRHRRYQLPTADHMGKVFPVHRDGDRLFTNGIEWSQDHMEGDCVLLTFQDGHFRLQMEDCKEEHYSVCFLPPDTPEHPALKVVERSELMEEAYVFRTASTLEIRREGGGLVLQVDATDDMWKMNVSLVPGSVVDQPSCDGLPLTFLGADISDDHPALTTYSITTNTEGLVVCEARFGPSFGIVSTEFINRISEVETYSLAARYPIRDCRHVLCDASIDPSLLQDARLLDAVKSIEPGANARVVQMEFGEKDQVIVYYKLVLEETPGDITDEIRDKLAGLDYVELRSSHFCWPRMDGVLKWPRTKIGESAVADGGCAAAGSDSITRDCLGDFVKGGHWGQIKGLSALSTCSRREFLELVVESENSGSELLNDLDSALSEHNQTELDVKEVRGISQALSKINPHVLQEEDIATIANITNNIIVSGEVDDSSLRVAQRETNSSNVILESLDNLLLGLDLVEHTARPIVESHFAAFVVDIDSAEGDDPSMVQALTLRKSSHLQSNDFEVVSEDGIFDDTLDEGVAAAVRLPSSLFTNELGTHRLVVTVFTSPLLFGSGDPEVPAPPLVISVTVNGTAHDLTNDPIRLLFAKDLNYSSGAEPEVTCVFWDFKANNNTGNWSTQGCYLDRDSEHLSQYDVCMCNHLTHFGRLLYTAVEYDNDTGTFNTIPDEPSLTYITIIGCSLSVLGLLGIFITAIVVPGWHRGTGKKIQLHLSAALFLLMTSFLVLAIVGEQNMHRIHCIITGAVSHFSLLALYLWMLAIAYYQYRRLTKPLEALKHIPHFLLVSATVAWGLPLVVCTVLLAIDVDTYGLPACYPTGQIQLYAIFVPVAVILGANTLIFVLILWSIFECRKCVISMRKEAELKNSQNDTRRIMLRLISSFYLFILLGLSWIFGFLKLQHLFCITATLQGFSLFIFFVILDKHTMAKWRRLVSKHLPKGTTQTGLQSSSGRSTAGHSGQSTTMSSAC